MEKQIQAKTVLHQTKQKLFKETAQRSSIIQKLEKEVIGLDVTAWLPVCAGRFPVAHQEPVGVFQVKRLICTLTEEREKFLEERRELLQKINKLEEEGVRSAATVQHRCVASIAVSWLELRVITGHLSVCVWIKWCALGSTCRKRKSGFSITKSRCSPDRTVP